MVMDIKEVNRQLAQTPEGRMMLLEQIVSRESLTGYFALNKIEELINENANNNMTKEELTKEILKVVVIAYNFAAIDDFSEEDTPKTQAIRDLLTEQRTILNQKSEKIKKSKP